MLTTLITLAALSGSGVAPAPAPAAEQLAIKAKSIWLGDGRVVEDGVVLISGGKIQRVGRGVEVPASATVLEHDGVLTAGMVALHGYTGAADDVDESTRALTPECDLIHAFRPGHPQFAAAAAAGITSMVLTPPANNLSGGVTCVVKTAGDDVLARRAQLSISICEDALQINRYPTSYAAALDELSARFTDGEGPFGEARSGALRTLIEVRSRQDVLRAVGLAGSFGLKGVLYGANLSGEVAEQIRASGLAVAFRPFDRDTSDRTLDAVVTLAEAGVPFGFGLDAPEVDERALRFSAALCVRAGVEPATAWKALTADAAKIAGVDARVGVVAQGLDADLVLWSGDPLDLGSSIEAVYVDGALVHGGGK